MAIRLHFEKQLELLHMDLVKMGSMVEQSIEDGIGALMRRDTQLAQRVIEGDKQVDDMEQQIENTCLRLLMREQPVAGDFRIVFAALKMITDMERIADQAADIAALSFRFERQTFGDMVYHIPDMERVAKDMVSAAIRSFVGRNLELALETMERDDEVDDLFDVVKNDLIELLREDDGGKSADQAIDVLMIAKYLERIADHAVNICEWVEYYITGVHRGGEGKEDLLPSSREV